MLLNYFNCHALNLWLERWNSQPFFIKISNYETKNSDFLGCWVDSLGIFIIIYLFIYMHLAHFFYKCYICPTLIF